MEEPTRVGLVGARFLAATRARCYAATGASVVAVTAASRESAERFAGQYGVPVVCASFEALIARDDVDVVDLCVPNLLHRPMTEAAAAAGKHVICTKPLTAYVAPERDPRTMLAAVVHDATEMIEACSGHGVKLFYGENWVYAPALRRARGLLRASGGVVLEMHGYEAHSGSHSEYSKLWSKTGGGALLRLGAHPVGAMLHIKRADGVRPVAVVADCDDLTRNPGLTAANTRIVTGWKDVENWGLVSIEFSDGSRGIARGSDNLLGGMESKVELLASNCHLECNLSPNDQLRAYAPDGSVFDGEYLMEKVDTGAGWSTPIPSEDWSSGQLDMIRTFVRDLRDDREPEADGQLGLDVVRVIYSAYVSAREGRRVELPD